MREKILGFSIGMLVDVSRVLATFTYGSGARRSRSNGLSVVVVGLETISTKGIYSYSVQAIFTKLKE